MLGEAGINIKLEVLEAGVMKDRLIEGKYDMHIDGGDITDDPVVTLMPWYYTSKVEKGRYSSAKVDWLLDTLGREFDEKKRLKIFRDLARTIQNDVGDIPLLFEVRFTGMSEKVQYGPSAGHSYSESGEYFKRTWLR